MTAAEIFEAAWPWVWPSLALIAWSGLMYLLLRVSKGWVKDRLNPQQRFGIEDRFYDRVTRALFFGAALLGIYGWLLTVPLGASAHAFVERSLTVWVMSTLLLLVFVAAGFYLVRRGLIWAGVRAQATESTFDDALVAALSRPLYITVILIGLNLWADLVPLPEAVAEYFSRGSETTVIVLIVLLVDGLAQGWMLARQEHSKVLKTSGVVLRSAVRISLYTIGALMALTSVGIDVTPIIASLGVTSIAIGLALQGTLEDFLAGLLLAADQPVTVGDFVELESGRAGVVLSIGWRTTRILTRDDMHVIVPNSALAKSTLVNRSRPREACKFLASCGVHYDSDLDQVVAVALAVGREVQQGDPRAVSAFEPKVVFGAFGGSSVDFGVWLMAKSWEDHFGVMDHFVRSLHRRFAAEGIVIPYPIRTLDVPPGTTVRIARDAPASPGSEEDPT